MLQFEFRPCCGRTRRSRCSLGIPSSTASKCVYQRKSSGLSMRKLTTIARWTTGRVPADPVNTMRIVPVVLSTSELITLLVQLVLPLA